MSDRYILNRYTLPELLSKSVSEHPNAVAQRYREAGSKDFQNITYQQIQEYAHRITAGLIALGMQKGDHIGLIADVGHRWMWASMGITGGGGVDVSRGTDATREELLYIFQHAGCKIIFLETGKVYDKIKDVIDRLSDLKTIIFFDSPSTEIPSGIQSKTLNELIQLGADQIKQNSKIATDAGEKVQPDDLATIIYTSGTTGTPKGVMLTHKNLSYLTTLISGEIAKDGIILTTADRSVGFLPPWHIGERLFESIMLFNGCSVAFTSITALAGDLRTVRPTVMFSVPRVWESFYNKILENVKAASPVQRGIFNFARWSAMKWSWHKANLFGNVYHLKRRSVIVNFFSRAWSLDVLFMIWPLNAFAQLIFAKIRKLVGGHLKFAISGAGALPEHIDRLFAAIGIPIFEAYGMTETTGVSCARMLTDHVIGTVGKPLGDIEVKLVDEQGNTITEPGIKGVAHHRGQHIMRGYYKEPEKTSATLLEGGWLNSGDLMVYTDREFLKFAGRAKDTIVLLGGENLEPEPIEFALSQSQYVHQVIVVGQDKKTLGALIVPGQAAIEHHLKDMGEKNMPAMADYNNNDMIVNLFKREIKERISANNGFKSFEKVTAFHLLPAEFTVGDELTQTMKMRRNVIFDKYAKEIDNMYR
ncbi:MAG: AMP-binding protein [Leptospiraceae bacterium]|nr:AMP-binding protein [Leptospiraceae bacterium]